VIPFSSLRLQRKLELVSDRQVCTAWWGYPRTQRVAPGILPTSPTALCARTPAAQTRRQRRYEVRFAQVIAASTRRDGDFTSPFDWR
jgi:hypothetical protein